MLFQYSLTKNTHKLFTLISILYLAFLIMECFAVYTQNNTLELFVKPTMLFMLIFYYIKTTKKILVWYLIAFFITIVANVLNIYNDQEEFLFYGILAITIYFLFYLFYFFNKTIKKGSGLKVLISFLLFVFCLGVANNMIFSNLTGVLFITILLITNVITLTCSLSFIIVLNQNTERNFWFLITFVIILIANLMFGIYRFHESIIFLKITAISCYAFFQYIICTLMVEEGEK